jgi:hypothetical protein
VTALAKTRSRAGALSEVGNSDDQGGDGGDGNVRQVFTTLIEALET